jgi:hypothetical protein
VTPPGIGRLNGKVAKLNGEKVVWQGRSRLRPLLALATVLVGTIAALLVAGSLLSIDNTANTVHLNTVQDVVGCAAFTAAAVVVLAAGVIGLRLAAPLVALTANTLTVFRHRRVTVPLASIRTVALVSKKPGSKTHGPAVVTTSGTLIKIPHPQSRLSSDLPDILLLEGLPTEELQHPRRAIRVARSLREHLPNSVAGPSLPTGSLKSDGIQTVDKLPTDIQLRAQIPQLVYRRRVIGPLTAALVVALFQIAGAQGRSGHPFDWAQFMVTAAIVFVIIVTFAAVLLFQSLVEVAIGGRWVATRAVGRPRWRLLNSDAVVGISPTRKLGGISICDAEGHGMTLRRSDLGNGVAASLLTLFGDRQVCVPSAIGLLKWAAGDLSTPPGGWSPRPTAPPVGTGWSRRHPVRPLSAWKQSSLRSDINEDLPGQAIHRRKIRMVIAVGGVAAVAFSLVGHYVATALNRVDLAIPGSPGYATFAGPEGKPMPVGRPWGTSCEPVVLAVASSVPNSIYTVIGQVVDQARADGVDVGIQTRNDKWFPSSLYPSDLTNSEVKFVNVVSTSSTPPELSDGQSEHITFGWDAQPDPDGSNEDMTYLQGVLYLQSLEGPSITASRSIRQLIAFSQGVGSSMAPGSGIATESSVNAFSPKDLAAMQTMSGCRFEPTISNGS